MKHVRGIFSASEPAMAVACDVDHADADSVAAAIENDPRLRLFLAISGLDPQDVTTMLRSLDARRAVLRREAFSVSLSAGDDSDERWTRLSLSPEGATGWVLRLADVTDDVQAEVVRLRPGQPLPDTGARLALDQLIASLPCGAVVLQASGPFGRLNPAARRLLGVSSLSEARRQIELLAGDVVASPTPRIAVREDEDGNPLTLLIAGTQVDLGGGPACLVTIFDISQAVPAGAAGRSDIADLNHELRTPLASLVGALDLLRDEIDADGGPRAQRLLDMATRNAARMSGLVEDLMALHEVGTAEVSSQQLVRVADAVAEAMDLNAGFAAAHNVRLCLDCDLKDEVIDADASALQRILANLISNAVKFSRPGRAVQIAASPDGGDVCISVRDRGIGIPAADLPHVFDRYYRATAPAHRRQAGSGLGLAVARDLAERMGGEIEASSATGANSGTLMIVRFPLAETTARAL